MKRIIFLISILLTVLLTGCSSNEKYEVTIFHDFSATEMLLDWFDNGMPESDIDAIANNPGMILMGQNALNNEKIKQPTFVDALRKFRTDTTSTDIYGIDSAYNNRKAIRELMDTLKNNNICDSAIYYAAQFLPDKDKLKCDFSAYFVPTGWIYGDAYIRSVIHKDDTYSIGNGGKPTSFFNLALICTGYGATAKRQMQMLKGVMSHEIFHVLFENYKRNSKNYASGEGNDVCELESLVHNEGIAHYISYRDDMKNYFSLFQPFEEKSFTLLNESFQILTSDTTSVQTREHLLRTANIGQFWDKYGSIAGMFMAYHIENELGFDILTGTVKDGDDSFFKAYSLACEKNKELPVIAK